MDLLSTKLQLLRVHLDEWREIERKIKSQVSTVVEENKTESTHTYSQEKKQTSIPFLYIGTTWTEPHGGPLGPGRPEPLSPLTWNRCRVQVPEEWERKWKLIVFLDKKEKGFTNRFWAGATVQQARLKTVITTCGDAHFVPNRWLQLMKKFKMEQL